MVKWYYLKLKKKKKTQAKTKQKRSFVQQEKQLIE